MQVVDSFGMAAQAWCCLVPGAGLLHSDALPDPSPAQFALLLVNATLPISHLPRDKRKYEKLQLSLPTVSAKLAYPWNKSGCLHLWKVIYTKDMDGETMHSWKNIPK